MRGIVWWCVLIFVAVAVVAVVWIGVALYERYHKPRADQPTRSACIASPKCQLASPRSQPEGQNTETSRPTPGLTPGRESQSRPTESQRSPTVENVPTEARSSPTGIQTEHGGGRNRPEHGGGRNQPEHGGGRNRPEHGGGEHGG